MFTGHTTISGETTMMNSTEIKDLFNRWFEDQEVVVLESGTKRLIEVRVIKQLGPFEHWEIEDQTIKNLAVTVGVEQVTFKEERNYLQFIIPYAEN
jgi:hypothetical protein